MDTTPRTDDTFYSKQRPGRRRFDWQLFWVLIIASLLALLPVLYFFFSEGTYSPLQIFLLVLFSLGEYLVIDALAVSIGLYLGEPLGFGVPMLRDWLDGYSDAWHDFLLGLPVAIVLGLLAGVIFVGITIFVGPLVGYNVQNTNISSSPPWQEFLRLFEANIREELWFRLGIMTLLIWVCTHIFTPGRLSPRVIWAAIILSALASGLYHIPAYEALAGGITGLVILQNTMLGIVYGWLYWRRGLLLAMIAHLCADLVIHLIFPSLLINLR